MNRLFISSKKKKRPAKLLISIVHLCTTQIVRLFWETLSYIVIILKSNFLSKVTLLNAEIDVFDWYFMAMSKTKYSFFELSTLQLPNCLNWIGIAIEFIFNSQTVIGHLNSGNSSLHINRNLWAQRYQVKNFTPRCPKKAKNWRNFNARWKMVNSLACQKYISIYNLR